MKRDFVLVTISLVIWGIGEGAFMFFQPLYLEELGASPLVIGGILGAVGLGMTLFHIPAGFLADRIGRRQLMWAAWAMGVTTTGIMASARTLQAFAVGMILYSITVFVVTPLNSYITAARGTLTVEQVMTTNTAAFYLGGIIGPLTGGALAQHFGIRSIYFFAFGLFVISSMIIIFIKPQPVEEKLSNPAGDLLRNTRYLWLMPLLFITYFALFFPQPLTPNFLSNARGLSLQNIGLLGSISNLGTVLINLLFGLLPAGLGITLGQLFVGLYAALIWQFTGMPIYVMAYFLLGGYRATRSLLIAQVEKLVKPANLGLAYGVSETVSGLALVAAPPIAGAVYSNNPESVFSISLLLIIPSIVLIHIWRRRPWNT